MTLIRHRNGTAAEWASVNPVLGVAERGVENDTGKEKIGDGVKSWTQLPYTVDLTGFARTTDIPAVALTKTNNLQDLPNSATARTNLGLGTAAISAATSFEPAGAAATAANLRLAKASNLSDLASAPTARTNLGLGTAATHAHEDYALPTIVARGLVVADPNQAGPPTVDNLATLNAIIASAAPGQVIELPVGMIGVSGPITPGVSPPQFVGQNAPVWGYRQKFSTVLAPTAGFVGTALIKMDGSNTEQIGATFKNLSLRGFSGTVTGGQHGIQSLGGVHNVTMDNVDIRDFSGSGVYVIPAASTGAVWSHPKGWRLRRVTSESHLQWGFWFDGLTDTDLLQLHAHFMRGSSTASGGIYLAGLGDLRMAFCRTTYTNGPGYRTGNSIMSGRPWGAGVQIVACGTDRSQLSAFHHAASNLNPIEVVGFTAGRDGRTTTHASVGVAGDSVGSSAVLVDGGGTTAGPISFDGCSTLVGYDDSGQGDTFSSPDYGLAVVNAQDVRWNGGSLWGKVSPSRENVGYVSEGTRRSSGTRLDPLVFTGIRGRGNYAEDLTARTTQSITYVQLATDVAVSLDGLQVGDVIEVMAEATATTVTGMQCNTGLQISNANLTSTQILQSSTAVTAERRRTAPGSTTGTILTAGTESVITGWLSIPVMVAGSATVRLVHRCTGAGSLTGTWTNRRLWVRVSGIGS